MAHAAERGRAWCWRWQSAVRVVVCQCRRIEVGQFLLARPVNPFLILDKCRICLHDNGWVGDSAGWYMKSVLSGCKTRYCRLQEIPKRVFAMAFRLILSKFAQKFTRSRRTTSGTPEPITRMS